MILLIIGSKSQMFTKFIKVFTKMNIVIYSLVTIIIIYIILREIVSNEHSQIDEHLDEQSEL